MTGNGTAYNLLPANLPQYSAEQKAALLERELAAALELVNRHISISTELARENASLIRERDTDKKTGLFNEYFMSRIGPEIVSQQNEKHDRTSKGKLIVAYIDVDGLKVVNDSEGHAAGDKLIETIAVELKKTFKRESDQYLIRKSGDEFVLILQNCTPEYLQHSLAKINKNTSFTFGSKHIDVRCSYGYSVFHGQSFEEMLAEADAGLYLNKAANKNSKLSTTITDLAVNRSPAPMAPQPA